MTDIYAGEQGAIDTRVKRQLEEENRYKLAEQMRVRDEAAKARDIITRHANEAQTQVQPQVQGILPGETAGNPNEVLGALVQPQGMIPQEGLTGFGGMSTPQQGPVGLQPQGDTTGLGGMQPTGWSETQAQAPAQDGHETALDKTSTVLEQANSKVDVIKQTMDALYKAGLPDQAMSYEKKMRDAQKEADIATLEHYKVAEKVVDFVGSQANGYLTAIKNPNVNADAAWQRMKLAVQTAGIDTSELDSVDPSQRAAYAEEKNIEAYSSKEQIALETTLLKDKTKRDLQNQTEKLRRDILAETTSNHAKVRELGASRLEWSKSKFSTVEERKAFEFRYKELHDGIKTQLSQSKVQLEEVDRDIKDIQTRKMELDKGNLYYDTNDHPISSNDEEARLREAKFLNDKLDILHKKKDDFLKDVQDLSTEQSELEKSLPKFAKEGAKAETSPSDKSIDRSQAVSKELITRFTNDPATKGMTLGKHTENGWEVKNTKGVVVGHYE